VIAHSIFYLFTKNDNSSRKTWTATPNALAHEASKVGQDGPQGSCRAIAFSTLVVKHSFYQSISLHSDLFPPRSDLSEFYHSLFWQSPVA